MAFQTIEEVPTNYIPSVFENLERITIGNIAYQLVGTEFDDQIVGVNEETGDRINIKDLYNRYRAEKNTTLKYYEEA